jgi:hypothetical protein
MEQQLVAIYRAIDPQFEPSELFTKRVLRAIKNEIAPTTVDYALFTHHYDTRAGIELLIDKIIFIIEHLTYRAKLKWE